MHDAQQIKWGAMAFVVLCPALSALEESSTNLVPIVETATPQREATSQLSAGESRIRAGIVLLGMLYDSMAKVQDHDTAEAAVPTVMRLAKELQEWGQGFTSLPPLDEATQSEYEKRYIPIINKLNERIQIQADRIAAAEFYGSENLPAALINLVNSVQ